MRQQAEVEVIQDYLSISKNKPRIHIDLTGAMMLPVLYCNKLFPKRGSSLILCGVRIFGLMFCQFKSDRFYGKYILSTSFGLSSTQSSCEAEKPVFGELATDNPKFLCLVNVTVTVFFFSVCTLITLIHSSRQILEISVFCFFRLLHK